MNSFSDFKARASVYVFRYKLRLAFVVGTLGWIVLLKVFVLFYSPLMRALLLSSFAVLFLGFSVAFSQLIASPIAFSLNTYLYDKKHKPEETELPELQDISKTMGVTYTKKIRLTDNPDVMSAYTYMPTKQITFPRSWKEKYTFEQLISIATHEVGHLTTKKRAYLDMVGVILGVAFVTLGLSYFLPAIFAQIGGLAAFYLLLSVALRSAEYRADEASAKVLGPEHLIEVLEDFDKDPKFSGGSESHPSPKARIRRLRKLFPASRWAEDSS